MLQTCVVRAKLAFPPLSAAEDSRGREKGGGGILRRMELRAATPSDLELLDEIDGTIESDRYLFVERSSEGDSMTFVLTQRPARQRLVMGNRMNDETAFLVRQIVGGIEEGMALVTEHGDLPVALLVAARDVEQGVMELVDLRVDYDFRRQGIGLAMMYQLIGLAREAGMRAVRAGLKTNNWPAISLLQKCGFELSGLDTHHSGNHDLVKEEVTLFWYVEVGE